jgi:hypothetical protein
VAICSHRSADGRSAGAERTPPNGKNDALRGPRAIAAQSFDPGIGGRSDKPSRIGRSRLNFGGACALRLSSGATERLFDF